MKVLSFVILFLSLSAQAQQNLTPKNQKLKCIGVGQTTFSMLNLTIDAGGEVDGSYSGYQAGPGQEISLQEDDQNIAWMQIAGLPEAQIAADGRIKIVLNFQGQMGSDEDVFTLNINRNNGKATMYYKSMADCGDGKWQKMPNEYYQCSALKK